MYYHAFISDLHLNSDALHQRGLSWFKPEQHKQRLLSLLTQELKTATPQLQQLTFLGDTFDTWLGPLHEEPPSYAQLLADHPWFVEALAQLAAQGTALCFVPGNHDFDLCAAALNAALPHAIIAPEVAFPKQRIIAQHGHELTFFNTTSFDPIDGRPLGYFLSRLAADRLPHGHSHSVPATLDYIRRGVLNAIHRPEALSHLLEGFFYKICGLGPTSAFILPGGHALQAQDIIARYHDVARQVSPAARLWRLTQRPTNLISAAAYTAKQRDASLVIFGHCHHTLNLKLPQARYINLGSWCEPDEASCLLLGFDPQQDDALRHIELKRYSAARGARRA